MVLEQTWPRQQQIVLGSGGSRRQFLPWRAIRPRGHPSQAAQRKINISLSSGHIVATFLQPFRDRSTATEVMITPTWHEHHRRLTEAVEDRLPSASALYSRSSPEQAADQQAVIA